MSEDIHVGDGFRGNLNAKIKAAAVAFMKEIGGSEVRVLIICTDAMTGEVAQITNMSKKGLSILIDRLNEGLEKIPDDFNKDDSDEQEKAGA
jgi:hypothetical protein